MNDLNLSTLAPIYSEMLQPVSWGLIGWTVGGIVIFVSVSAWLWCRGKRVSKTPDAIAQLQKLDFEIDSTETLYSFSLLMQSLPLEKQPHNLSELIDAIEPYKYSSNPPSLPYEIKAQLIQAIHKVAV